MGRKEKVERFWSAWEIEGRLEAGVARSVPQRTQETSVPPQGRCTSPSAHESFVMPLLRRVIFVFGYYAKRRHATSVSGHEADVRLLGPHFNGPCVSPALACSVC